jgi:hypothetical protein
VRRDADTLIGGFMKLIGQAEVWENIKRGNAVARAWAWFQGALAGVVGFVRQVPTLFLDALRALEIADLVLLPRAFARVGRVFAGFAGQFFSWAGQQVLSLLQIVFEVVAPRAVPYVRRAAGAFRAIIQDPIGFVGKLVRAGIQGFRQFAANFLTHLRRALIGWLTGALRGASVYIPQGLHLREILKFVLSVLGLTWHNVRGKLVRAVGETAVVVLERRFDLVVTLVQEGPAAAWERIVESVGNLRDMVIEQVMSFVRTNIVQAAVIRLVSSLNPAGAFIQAIIAIYNTVMFFVERLQQIGEVAMSFIDSIAAIASGAIGAAASRVEQTMAGLLTLVISFLARLVGLGNVAQTVTSFVNRVRQPIDRALDRVVEWIVTQARRLGRLIAAGARGVVARAVNWWSGRRSFTAADRTAHSLYFQGQGPQATLTVSTVPTPVDAFLTTVAPAVGASSDQRAKSDLAAAQALLRGSLRARLRALNAPGATAPAPADVDQLNAELITLSNLLVSLVPYDPRVTAAVAAASVSLPVGVDTLIKLKTGNQIAVVVGIVNETIGAGSAAAGQVYQIVRWRILRPRGRSAAGGTRAVDFVRDWGRLYEAYVNDPRDLYLGATPEKSGPVGTAVKRRMHTQGKYDPATGLVLYSRDVRGRALLPGQPAQSVHENNCDMGHIVDAVVWWNSNGRLTFPQSPEVLRFMSDPDNYELEPSGPNRARGAALGAGGVTYRPPVG